MLRPRLKHAFEIAEQKSIALEQQFRGLLEATTIPLAEMRSNGEIVWFNSKFTETFGWTRADIPHLDQWWLRVFPDASYRNKVAADWELVVQACLAGEQHIAPWEYRMTCANGELKQVQISQRAHGDSLMVSFVDVTDMRRFERALQDQLRFQEALIDTIPNPIFIKDAEARFIGCNRAYEQAFATTRESMRGKRVVDLHNLPAADRAAYQAEDAELIAIGGVRHDERSIPFADGRNHDVLYWVASFDLSDGCRGGLIGIIVDISALKEAQRQAAAATRAKADFFAHFCHEIRTPMNAITGMTQLALHTEPTPKQQHYLQQIDKASRLLLRLFDDILDYTKSETGQLDIVSTGFQLAAVFNHVRHRLYAQAREKGLALSLDQSPDLPRALIGDAARLTQILFNLADNAIKFTEQGEVRIQVAFDDPPPAEDDAQLWLRFRVQDTGIGISDAEQKHLFRLFSHTHNATPRRHSGAGVGLVISQRLCERMGGQMGVESEPGKGSTFWFTACFGRLTEATAPAEPDDLPALPGFDLNARFNQCSGNPSRYRDLLTSFARQHRHTAARLGELIARGKFELARRQVHSLKAMADIIGHQALAKAAGNLQQELQQTIGVESTRVLAEQLATLTTELSTELSMLEPLLTENTQTNPPGKMPPEVTPDDPETLDAVLTELAPEIKACRATRCRARLRKLQALHWPDALAAEAEHLERLLASYRYKQALPVLERLREKLFAESGFEAES